MLRRPASWFSALVVLALPAAAVAWTAQAEFGVRVHGHEFHKVVIENSSCAFKYRLYFSAPSEGYAKDQARPYYRFRARIKLQGGQVVLSRVFGNSGPGERVYESEYDTSADGCWAKEAQKLFGVDVRACRGRGCTPEMFE